MDAMSGGSLSRPLTDEFGRSEVTSSPIYPIAHFVSADMSWFELNGPVVEIRPGLAKKLGPRTASEVMLEQTMFI